MPFCIPKRLNRPLITKRHAAKTSWTRLEQTIHRHNMLMCRGWKATVNLVLECLPYWQKWMPNLFFNRPKPKCKQMEAHLSCRLLQANKLKQSLKAVPSPMSTRRSSIRLKAWLPQRNSQRRCSITTHPSAKLCKTNLLRTIKLKCKTGTVTLQRKAWEKFQAKITWWIEVLIEGKEFKIKHSTRQH